MAEPTIITDQNYASLLKLSTAGRSGTPNGNIFFDTTNGKIELYDKTEVAQIDLGNGAEDNPLDLGLGITMIALYNFESLSRRTNEALRQFDRFISGTYKFAGAYNFINSRKPAGDKERRLIRNSGWKELAKDGGVDRIYFGIVGLNNIEDDSQPYYQLASGGIVADFAKPGQINEAVQIFGSTGNTPSDTTAGNFDNTTFLSVSIRTFGNNFDRKDTLNDLGQAEIEGFATGMPLNESEHLTTKNFVLADVVGNNAKSPFTGMSLEQLVSPRSETGFNEEDGSFTWVLHNSANGSLDQCVAYLDAIATLDEDVNAHSTIETFGKRVGTWYSYDAFSRIQTKSGTGAGGLFIENIPTEDEQRIVFVDDSGSIKTRPFKVAVSVDVGANAIADENAWYHGFFAGKYNTDTAVTIVDSNTKAVKGLVKDDVTNGKILFPFDYTGDTIGGAAATDKDCVFLVEGDGKATAAKTLFTIIRATNVSFACAPTEENNA